jgi:hypothetical protein
VSSANPLCQRSTAICGLNRRRSAIISFFVRHCKA